MPRKTKWKAKPFESVGSTFIDQNGTQRKDSCAQMYESMLTHPAYMTLKPRQKVLYLYCKAQLYGKRKPSKDYDAEQYPDLQSEFCFYMNWGTVKAYELYSNNGQHEFYNDIKELQKRGFIEVVVSGKATKSKSVYRFCGEWKTWKQN